MIRRFSSTSIRLGTRLLAASTTIAAAMALQACSTEPNTSGTYPDAQACTTDGMFSRDYCETSFRSAKEEHVRRAPHYATRQDCEADWNDGNCDELADENQNAARATGGGHVYAPHMNGYWVGYTGGGSSNTPARAYVYPVYRARGSGLVSPITGQEVGTFGRNAPSPSFSTASETMAASRPVFSAGGSLKAGTSVSGISRGGFGSIARGGGFSIGS